MSDRVVTFPIPAATDQDRQADLFGMQRMAVLEAIIFSADEPPNLSELAAGLGSSEQAVQSDLDELIASYESDSRGIQLRVVGGRYRISTKAEHHEAIRSFAKSTKPRLRLSMPALETLAVVAYRQPVTIPEIQAIRGKTSVAGVIHTLLNHKLVATAGRKKVVGRPMRYKTTEEFLIHFGLNALSELPTLKEMEDLGRSALEEDGLIDSAEEAEAESPSGAASSDEEPDD